MNIFVVLFNGVIIMFVFYFYKFYFILQVLVKTIPPKQEYVIYVRMTDIQCLLYRAYLTIVHKRDRSKWNNHIFCDYYMFSRIWTHPYLLIMHEKDIEKKRLFQEDQEFCVSDDSSISHESIKNVF